MSGLRLWGRVLQSGVQRAGAGAAETRGDTAVSSDAEGSREPSENTAVDRDEAELVRVGFEETWGRQYPMITQSWRSNWERAVPFLDFPPDLRPILYTTNAIE